MAARPGWHDMRNGWKIHVAENTTKLFDGREQYDEVLFPCRTTLFQSADGRWRQVENSERYSLELNPYAVVSSVPRKRMTLFAMSPFSETDEGCFYGVGLTPKRPEPEEQEEIDPMVEEISSEHAEIHSELIDSAVASGSQEVQPGPVEHPVGMSVTLGSSTFTKHSPLQELRAGCKLAGLTTHGTKKDSFERLADYVMYAEDDAVDNAADTVAKDLVREANEVPRPEQAPSAEEQENHRLTHIPFVTWCPSCIATRAREDHRRPSAEARVPVVQRDYCYTYTDPSERQESEGDEIGSTLVAIDLDTKMLMALAVPSKGTASLKRSTEELCRFTMAVQGENHIIIQSDGEPAIKAVVKACAEARAKLGQRTTQRTTGVAQRASNGSVERAVQTVRRLANCLVHSFEEKRGKLPQGHCLRTWSFGHSAFLYNRYHVHPNLQKTSYELVGGGRAHDGRLCIFGETVFGKVVNPYKGEASWRLGIWCGVSTQNNNHMMMTKNGYVECYSVRRSATQLTLEEVTEYNGYPWEKIGTIVKYRKKRAAGNPNSRARADGRQQRCRGVAGSSAARGRSRELPTRRRGGC